MEIKSLHGLNLENKKVLLRADLNVPINNNKVSDTTRIQELKPTIQFLLKQNAKIAICSHFGRPNGIPTPKFSLNQLISELNSILEVETIFIDNCLSDKTSSALNSLSSNQVILLENTRFYSDEENNTPHFAEQLAQPFDLFINDAFAAAHRAHASTQGVTQFLSSYAGLLMEKELKALTPLLDKNNTQKPLTLIISGAKIDTKIGVIEKFIGIADNIIIGGALANTFLLAQNYPVGKSLVQADKIDLALKTLEAASQQKTNIILPTDVTVATEISAEAIASNKTLNEVAPEDLILDIGTQSIKNFTKIINNSKTIILNGPLGIYEFPQFSNGTKSIIQAIASNTCVSILGGGDTIDALNQFQISHSHFTHISTGGGAMIEFMEGQQLPAILPLLK